MMDHHTITCTPEVGCRVMLLMARTDGGVQACTPRVALECITDSTLKYMNCIA